MSIHINLFTYLGLKLSRIFIVEGRNYFVRQTYNLTISSCELGRTLHEQEHTKGMSRMQFFVIAAVGSFAWYILPGYLFATITSLSWVCWAWKDSIAAHQIGSGMQFFHFLPSPSPYVWS